MRHRRGQITLVRGFLVLDFLVSEYYKVFWFCFYLESRRYVLVWLSFLIWGRGKLILQLEAMLLKMMQSLEP